MTNSSTRIPRCEVVGLCEAIFAENPDLPVFGTRVLGGVPVRAPDPDPGCGTACPRSCSPSSTASCRPPSPGVIGAYTPLIARALEVSVPTVEDLDPTAQLIIDGTLLQCWSWADHPELYSGKHRTTGVNVQVSCTLSSPGFCGGWFIWCRWLPVVIVRGGGGRVPRRLRARRGGCPYVVCQAAAGSFVAGCGL